jgi:hypothetical protein
MGTTLRSPRRRETRALLRAHLAAAARYRHVTRHCPVCHRLLRLAMEHAREELPHAATEEPRQVSASN